MKVQAVLPHVSGLAEDITVNTFHFMNVDTGSERDTVAELIEEFYNDVTPTSGLAVAGLLGRRLSRQPDAVRLKFYNLAGGSPVQEETFTLAARADLGGGDHPDEVAVCLSFRSNYSGLQEQVPGGPAGPAGDTRPRARRRGRIFLGPLSEATMIDNPADVLYGHVSPGTQQTFGQAGARLLSNSIAAGLPFATWSETDSALRQVVELWVDNAFDVQRRRGRKATNRWIEPGGTLG